MDAVLTHVEKELISRMSPKVVLNCANGTFVPFLPEILSMLGSEAILFGCQPTNLSAKKFAVPSPESISIRYCKCCRSGYGSGYGNRNG